MLNVEKEKNIAEIVSDFCICDSDDLKKIGKYFPKSMKAIENISKLEPRLYVKPIYVEMPAYEQDVDVKEYQRKMLNRYAETLNGNIAEVSNVKYKIDDPNRDVLDSVCMVNALSNSYAKAINDAMNFRLCAKEFTTVSTATTAYSSLPSAFVAVLFAFNELDDHTLYRLGYTDSTIERQLYETAARYRNSVPSTEHSANGDYNKILTMIRCGNLYVPRDQFPRRIVDDPSITTSVLADHLTKLLQIFSMVMLVPKTGFLSNAVETAYKKDEESGWIDYFNEDDYAACQAALANDASACVVKCSVGLVGDDEADDDISVLVLNADSPELINTMKSLSAITRIMNYPGERINELYDSFEILTAEKIKYIKCSLNEN